MKLAITQVHANPDQPRKHFDADALAELARSIRAQGLLQPIVVRPMDDGTYQIVGGERRWRAHHLLVSQGHHSFDHIEATVKDMDDATRDIAAIIENMVRQDVTPLEEADAFKRLIEIGMTAEEIASKTGTVAHRIRLRLQLHNLEPSIRKLFERDQIDRKQATEIARLSDHAQQLKILKLINSGQIGNWNSVKHAVDTILGTTEQDDIFGALAPAVSSEDVRTLNSMERKIEQVVSMVSSGWKDGECVIANRVSPDRAKLMADKLKLIRQHVKTMERLLRNKNAQAVATLNFKQEESHHDSSN